MQSDTKIKVLSVVTVVCLAIIVGMGYHSWKMSREINALHEDITRMQPLPVNPLLSIPELPETAIDPWSMNNDVMEQFKEMDKRMNEMMHSMSSQQSFFNHHSFGLSASNPKIQMTETDKAYQVIVDVPDGQNVEINTSIKDNLFSISGLIKSSTQSATGHNASISRFSQSVYLAHKIDEKGIETKQEANRTVITIPKV